MSTSEEIPLQALDSEQVKDGKDLESQGQVASSPSNKGTTAPSRWSWKKTFTTVTTLIAYAFLNAGISVVAPFYPIEVSFIFIDRSSCPFLGTWKFKNKCSRVSDQLSDGLIFGRLF